MAEHPEREHRLRKLNELRAAGLEGYALRYPGASSLAAARALWEAGDHAGKPPARVAGRLMLKRVMGKLSFASLRDASGDLQLAFEREALGERYETFKKFLDLADVIGCEGHLGQTQKGETTLYVESFELLSKALLPLPEKYHGLADPELRYRQRHLDLIVNREVAEVFRARATILREIRAFLDERGFIEVETPVLQPIYGGAAARPFTTHHRTLDLPLYLRIADELYLKRLIVGGMERVYELSKNFRNEGIDKFHNPEFSFMECYQAWADYHDMMELVESLLLRLALKLRGAPTLTWEGQTVDLQPPWPRLPIIDAIRQYADVEVEHKSADELRAACTKLAIAFDPAWGAAKLIDEIFSAKVEPELLGPVFITDYPIETTPLARRHREHAHLVERFECFLFRREFGNAYSELNDPLEQRRRLEEQQALLAGGDAEAHPLDEDFLTAMEQGLPPTGGLGLGVDRLVMFLTGAANIRDVILFPLLRPPAVNPVAGERL